MKEIIVGLTLLISMSVFADDVLKLASQDIQILNTADCICENDTVSCPEINVIKRDEQVVSSTTKKYLYCENNGNKLSRFFHSQNEFILHKVFYNSSSGEIVEGYTFSKP